MPKNKNNKIRLKEEGLVDLVKSGLYTKSDTPLKPRFWQMNLTDLQSGEGHVMVYPVSSQKEYADHVLNYLGSLHRHLTHKAGSQEFSFEIDPVQFQKYRELSEKMNIYKTSPKNSFVLNEWKALVEQRKKWQELLFTKGTKHDLINMISTPENTIRGDKEKKEVIIDAHKYRPVCNNTGWIGTRMGVDKKTNGIVWEAYNLTNEFTNYLKQVHQIITGANYDSYQGNVPLQIHLYGINGMTEQEREKKEQQIKELAKEYVDDRVDSKFMHAVFDKREGDLYINHIDGSIMNYDFERLRQRLFTWRDEKGMVKKEDYKKVFKINMNPELEHKGFVLPIYSSLDNPKEFDMHDTVETFMGRYTL